MLPDFFKFHCVNNTGQSFALNTDQTNCLFKLEYKGWKIASDALSYQAEQTINAPTGSDVADGASFEWTEIDNSTDKYFGVHVTATLTSDITTMDGTFDIYAEFSPDGGTTYPSDAAEFDPELDLQLVAVLSFNHSGSGSDVRAINFTYEG